MPIYAVHVTDFTTLIALEHSWMHHSNFIPFMHSLDYVREEPESEVQAEQAQVEALTNLALDQGKPWCISTNPPCLFNSNHYFLFNFLLCIKFIGVV
jgi:hypothetical protein